jgi:hypothetical protein
LILQRNFCFLSGAALGAWPSPHKLRLQNRVNARNKISLTDFLKLAFRGENPENLAFDGRQKLRTAAVYHVRLNQAWASAAQQHGSAKGGNHGLSRSAVMLALSGRLRPAGIER